MARDEEAILEACLQRLSFADERVVVLDRCTDGSSAIAARYADTLIEGAWEIEGERRNLGIQACSGDWILEVDADEWVSDEMAREVRTRVAADEFDAFDIPVRNYVGTRWVKHGWGGWIGKTSYQGLFRKGHKHWGAARVHPHVEVSGRLGPDLVNGIDHHIDRDTSDMMRRLDRYTDWRARDLVERGETTAGLASMFRKFLSRFWKVYVARQAYKEKELGFMIALCGALYPLIAHIKAVELLAGGPGRKS